MASKLNPSIITRQGLEMRAFYDFSKHKMTNWFPGHMAKGTIGVQAKLSAIDCIIEVHDARIPFSGRNNTIVKAAASIKPHLLIFNKLDLITMKEKKKIESHLEDNGFKNFMFTNCKNHMDVAVKSMVPTVVNLIEASHRYNRAARDEYKVMIMGIPNVGKSSLINAIRARTMGKKKGTRVGPHPGVTKSVLERIKIFEKPPIYLLDTPGILAPRIESVEVGLKLALCNTVKTHLIGEEAIADYLLFKLNCCGNHKYVDLMKIDEPTDDVSKLLNKASKEFEYFSKKRDLENGGYIEAPDLVRTANAFVELFQKGHFGSLDLDEVMYGLKAIH